MICEKTAKLRPGETSDVKVALLQYFSWPLSLSSSLHIVRLETYLEKYLRVFVRQQTARKPHNIFREKV